MSADFFDSYARRYQPYKGGNWCYEDGCLYRGLELWRVETKDDRWLDHLRRLVDVQVGQDGSLTGYGLSDYNIDNILPGRTLLYFYGLTVEARYLTAVDLLARQLTTHPRTQSGVY